jgi:hypothetical protein
VFIVSGSGRAENNPGLIRHRVRSKWECKYHVVFIPRCRRRTRFEQLRQNLGELFRRLAERKECRIEEGQSRESLPLLPSATSRLKVEPSAKATISIAPSSPFSIQIESFSLRLRINHLMGLLDNADGPESTHSGQSQRDAKRVFGT